MKPIDYIYKNLGHLNMTVLKQLITDAGETVSEEIYDYLKETPWNTNTAILKEMGLDIERSSGESEEVFELTFSGHRSYGFLKANKTAGEIKDALANKMKMNIEIIEIPGNEPIYFSQIIDTQIDENSGTMQVVGYDLIFNYSSLDIEPVWSI